MFKCVTCDKEFDTVNQLKDHNRQRCSPDKEIKEERKPRKPFGAPEPRLGVVEKNKDYHYRWFNDNDHSRPGRVARAEQAGYVRVEHENNGRTCGVNADGSEIKQQLMKIRIEDHEEDMKERDIPLQQIEQQILQGTYEQAPNDHRFRPGQGTTISTIK